MTCPSEDQTTYPVSTWPAASLRIAVKWALCPGASVSSAGVIVTEATPAAGWVPGPPPHAQNRRLISSRTYRICFSFLRKKTAIRSPTRRLPYNRSRRTSCSAAHLPAQAGFEVRVRWEQAVGELRDRPRLRPPLPFLDRRRRSAV